MPITTPLLDTRTYQQLLDEALARIPVHTPEWTNFNKSDPGITIIETFAFLTESLLYRCNQIPERNRRAFLKLLGIPLQPATAARGIVTFNNERGEQKVHTLPANIELRAGQVPFRTLQGLDVLPIEAQIYYKHPVLNPPDRILHHYEQLYRSYLVSGQNQPQPRLYETLPLTHAIDLANDTVDGAIWVALLVRANDKPYATNLPDVRALLTGKTLNLGIAPTFADHVQHLTVGNMASTPRLSLSYEIPNVQNDGIARYDRLDVRSDTDVLREAGIVQITLPNNAHQLTTWNNLEPLEAGVGNFPPALDDMKLNERVLTWLRIAAPSAPQARLSVLGINAITVIQRVPVQDERLPQGTGEPDQVIKLAHQAVLSDTVQLTIMNPIAPTQPEHWQPIDNLWSAGSEVADQNAQASARVFVLDPEAGEIRFGDGLRGARPPFGAIIRADYAYSVGQAGNVAAGAINSSPMLPAGMKVTNPQPTWGGANAESVAEGEKQVARYLQHRDRLVNAADFVTITRRTPGVQIGRVDVLPAFTPELATNESGDAPGAVTLLVLPRTDPLHPDTPEPDRVFLQTICRYLEPRRLVTTELFVRGAVYKSIWISLGFTPVAGVSEASVREAIKQAMRAFLSPLPLEFNPFVSEQASCMTAPQDGWSLRKPVFALELLAVASRVSGVLLINNVLLGNATGDQVSQIAMNGLELPRIAGLAVAVGDALDLDSVRSASLPVATPFLPVPFVPETC